MASFCAQEYLQALLDVEVVPAAGEAAAGVIPRSCVHEIRAAAARRPL